MLWLCNHAIMITSSTMIWFATPLMVEVAIHDYLTMIWSATTMVVEVAIHDYHFHLIDAAIVAPW